MLTLRSTFAKLFTILKSRWFLGIIDQLLCGVGNFLTGTLIARSSSLAEFGLFSLGTTIILLLVDIQAGLISTPQSINTAGYIGKREKSFSGSTLVHQICLGMAVSVLLYTVIIFLRVTGSGIAGLAGMLPAIATFSLFVLMREYLRRYFYTVGQVGRVVLFDSLIIAVQLSVVYAIASWNLASAFLAHSIVGSAAAFFSLLTIYSLRSKFAVVKKNIWPDFISNFRIGKWAVVNNLSWTAGAYAYPWLLALIHGTQSTAVWAACMSIIGIMNMVLAGILNVLTPSMAKIFAEGDLKKFRRYVLRMCWNYVAVAIVLSIAPIIFGSSLITYVYGQSYDGAHPIIALLAANAIFGAVTGAAGRGLMVLGLSKEDFIVNIIVLSLVFTVGLWGTSRYGVVGAAASLAFANALGAAMRLFFFNVESRRLLKVGYSV